MDAHITSFTSVITRFCHGRADGSMDKCSKEVPITRRTMKSKIENLMVPKAGIPN